MKCESAILKLYLHKIILLHSHSDYKKYLQHIHIVHAFILINHILFNCQIKITRNIIVTWEYWLILGRWVPRFDTPNQQLLEWNGRGCWHPLYHTAIPKVHSKASIRWNTYHGFLDKKICNRTSRISVSSWVRLFIHKVTQIFDARYLGDWFNTFLCSFVYRHGSQTL